MLSDESWRVQVFADGGWWWVHRPPKARGRIVLVKDRRIAASVGAVVYARNTIKRVVAENPKVGAWRIVESKWGRDRVIEEGTV